MPSLSFAGPNPLQVACSKEKSLILASNCKDAKRRRPSQVKSTNLHPSRRKPQDRVLPVIDSGMRAEAALVKRMDVPGKTIPENVKYVLTTPQMSWMGNLGNPSGARYQSYLRIETIGPRAWPLTSVAFDEGTRCKLSTSSIIFRCLRHRGFATFGGTFAPIPSAHRREF